jgi:hypothetical protein
MIILKRFLIVCVVLMFVVTACSKSTEINLATSVENLPTVKTVLGTDVTEYLNYQGYISIKTNMSKSDVKKIKQVTIKGISFGENKNDIPVMYRYNIPFTDETVKLIYNETKRGNVNDTYTYTPDQFDRFGFQKTAEGEYTTKIQYLIMQVKPEIKPEDVRRKVSFTMLYEFNNGKKVEKNLDVYVP